MLGVTADVQVVNVIASVGVVVQVVMVGVWDAIAVKHATLLVTLVMSAKAVTYLVRIRGIPLMNTLIHQCLDYKKKVD